MHVDYNKGYACSAVKTFIKLTLKYFKRGEGVAPALDPPLITALFNLLHLYSESKYDFTQRINTQIIKSVVFNLMLHSGVQI